MARHLHKKNVIIFYAVVIDATFPYKTNVSKYVCSLKIVDPILFGNGCAGSIDFATLILYAAKFEDLPIIQRIGDIIRIHRATLILYKNKRQFNANIFLTAHGRCSLLT